MRLFPESLLHVLIFWLTLFSLIGLAMFMQALWVFWQSTSIVRQSLDLEGLFVFVATGALDAICIYSVYRSTTLKK